MECAPNRVDGRRECLSLGNRSARVPGSTFLATATGGKNETSGDQLQVPTTWKSNKEGSIHILERQGDVGLLTSDPTGSEEAAGGRVRWAGGHQVDGAIDALAYHS